MAATWCAGLVDGERVWRQAGRNLLGASDVGWVVGHSYIVYAPLLHGCTTILFEGKPVGTPDAGTFWRVIAEHGVVALFTAPTAFRAIKQGRPEGELVKQIRPVEIPHPVPGRRARRSATRSNGRRNISASR
jgi:acyl-coenzyme A synthetase/AMP-(fatty) acid ligase